ncbi:TIR domain-containing protein [Streptomyces scabiei]|uniref:TIR domain-containing protein n=1 Tax=Streptomyces scabiei TaxID=1930 RepID=UPI00299052C9|nr:TIR domain-containing protein [Streptomyces scabiei]MDW8807584.1 TIR domain-containing protein [Streptomyces scabiei]
MLLIANGEKSDRIAEALASNPLVSRIERSESAEYSFGSIRRLQSHGVPVDAIFIDPFADSYDPHQSSLFIVSTRGQYPRVVFVLIIDPVQFAIRSHEFLPELRQRVKHYYRLDWTVSDGQLKGEVERALHGCLEWHGVPALQQDRRGYEFDVAISFAGEDRGFAQVLERELAAHGVHAFYDENERPQLWGRDLYSDLLDIYARRSRYCIMLVSHAYREKSWTVHERRAAQSRALEMREEEYVLPVRLEDCDIPGLPSTIAYLPGELGPAKVAEYFLRKLRTADSG